VFESISLKFTEAPGELTIPGQGVTIFVGPNNSGKSLILREIEADISNFGPIETKLLKQILLIWPTDERIEADISILKKERATGVPTDHVHVGGFLPNGNLDGTNVKRDQLVTHLQRRTHDRWITSLGGDPRQAAYVHPGSGDVWDFIRNIVAWVKKPDRKGTS
jgi:ABC-type enterochelin transport system ATPase subunit